MEITENTFIDALNYRGTKKIFEVIIPPVVCGSEDTVYGNIFLTKDGVDQYKISKKEAEDIDYKKGFFSLPPSVRSRRIFFKSYENLKNLKTLENAIKDCPGDFDPSSDSSVFSIYKEIEVIEMYEDFVSVIMRQKGFGGEFSTEDTKKEGVVD
ncbi:MAG: hypothetical protein HZB68_04740 [Candidatus Aenigmarchaeota archaeon]|nr:hypothetical protein [Candidatus Aenigmarchaeota archaeon]